MCEWKLLSTVHVLALIFPQVILFWKPLKGAMGEVARLNDGGGQMLIAG